MVAVGLTVGLGACVTPQAATFVRYQRCTAYFQGLPRCEAMLLQERTPQEAELCQALAESNTSTEAFPVVVHRWVNDAIGHYCRVDETPI